MQTRTRKLHVKTGDGEASIELNISRLEGGVDRANLNAWLSQSVRTNVTCAGSGRSSSSSQSKCGVEGASATGRVKAPGATGGIRLDMSEKT